MKKAANILLTVGKILGIVAIIACAVASVIILIAGIVGGVAALGAATTDEETAAGVAAIVAAVAGSIGILIYMVCQIVGLSLVKKAKKGLANAKCKADAKKPGILAIVGGALGTGLGIIAGIFMLVMNDGYYHDEAIADQVVAEEEAK